MSNNVLIVDDDYLSSKALCTALERINPELKIEIADSAQQALAKISQTAVALVDLSLDASGPNSGLNLITEILKKDHTVRIIVLTSHEASEYGIQALHRGAASFVEKPANPEHLLALINDSISLCNIKRSFLDQHSSNSLVGIKTRSEKMLKTLSEAQLAATNNRPILIIGETGSGKGVLAREIHKASKLNGAFIRFQPSFTSGDLIASELFGHEKGAFTGANAERKGLIEEADKGTLFIDEVDELPKETQVSLLNVLQENVYRRLGSNRERKSTFRLIAASNRTKADLLTSDKIRPDFFHRIAHGIIEIPPLRERAEDISELSSMFLQKLSDKEDLVIQGVSDRAFALLKGYSWPGNIRELQAVIEGAAYRSAFKDRRFIDAEDLEIGEDINQEITSFREKVRDYELKLVLDALRECDNNQSKAAAMLQLDRSSLRRIVSKK